MVNIRVIVDAIQKVPVNKENGGAFMKHLFTVDKDLRQFWDVEELEPEEVTRSQRVVMDGAHQLSALYGAITAFEKNPRNFKSELHQMASDDLEKGLNLQQAMKRRDALISFLTEKSSVTPELKAEIEALFKEAEVELQKGGLS